ncbi:hypothetical protein C4M97_00495 [Mycoplasmopsis pullorum]|uniref:hypothetical protein n=1 Tax=Mycoplasmopsis pullorum TaxID=48003 RepID=UPI00111BC52D|nr:hypothetical protein [Mycoplasmopsis pullorum]TNK81823.1 hypothetical protein C4M80_03860 [Mycoplasmopsis pullorum]TNK82002.1 hypothetical protein C4M94_02325 [Mycoplasmopsis pullorum]TNK84233.1 hypothetical protein C4M92_03735 [Mycoplasmopsis pullorum]TNK84255.1 hypothetical protein C4M81_02860 [Mycoplasmopsis pullorum]TNK85942.1 hypothetical protein C4M85_01930 [Mycoplasmopsis pullorum]
MELLNVYTYHLGENQVYLHRVIENEYYIKGLWEEDIENNTNKRFDYFHCEKCYFFVLSVIYDKSNKFTLTQIESENNYKTSYLTIIGFINKNSNQSLCLNEIKTKLKK